MWEKEIVKIGKLKISLMYDKRSGKLKRSIKFFIL